MKDPKIQFNSDDEIVIVIPEDIDEDEIEIDLDKLGIDIENLNENVNIVVQMEGIDELDDNLLDEEFISEPNEWFFDDDPYGIVYYEFPEEFNDED